MHALRTLPLTIFLLCLLSIPGRVQAVEAVPGLLAYQGRVQVDGLNFTGTGIFRFVLLDGGDQSLWSNDGSSVAGSEPSVGVVLAVENGLFSVLLGEGDMVPVPASAFRSETVRLRVWFDDGSNGSQLLADRRIAAVGYALVAADLAPGALSRPEVIADALITPAKLDGSGAEDGQVLMSDGVVVSWGTPAGGGTVTEVASGGGLTGGPITETGTLSIAEGGVATEMLADLSVTSAKVSADIALTSGRLGGQHLHGGLAAEESLVLESTADVSKGLVAIQPAGGGVAIGAADLLHAGSALEVAGPIRYRTAQSRDMVIDGSAFQPAGPFDDVIDSGLHFDAGLGAYLVNGNATTLIAPVQLPHGASVQTVDAFLPDVTWSDPRVQLYRLHLIDGSREGFGDGSTEPDAGLISLDGSGGSWNTVDNVLYSYHLELSELTINERAIRAVRINYEVIDLP